MPVDTIGQRLLLHYRRALQVFLHLVLWTVALVGAFLLRFEFSLPDEYFPNLYVWLGIVVVAGDAGEHLLREMQRVYSAKYIPVACADDDARKLGQSIHGIPVLGPLARVPEIAKAKRVDEIIIAIPSATGRDMRRIIDLC